MNELVPYQPVTRGLDLTVDEVQSTPVRPMRPGLPPLDPKSFDQEASRMVQEVARDPRFGRFLRRAIAVTASLDLHQNARAMDSPFMIVYGVPSTTPYELTLALRESILELWNREMNSSDSPFSIMAGIRRAHLPNLQYRDDGTAWDLQTLRNTLMERDAMNNQGYNAIRYFVGEGGPCLWGFQIWRNGVLVPVAVQTAFLEKRESACTMATPYAMAQAFVEHFY